MAAATQRYILRLSRFGQGMNAVVRVTTNAGSTEYRTGPLGYDGYWILPLNLAPGERVSVEVRHSNGQAAAGSYAISFGHPVAGEPGATLPRAIYLPSIIR